MNIIDLRPLHKSISNLLNEHADNPQRIYELMHKQINDMAKEWNKYQTNKIEVQS